MRPMATLLAGWKVIAESTIIFISHKHQRISYWALTSNSSIFLEELAHPKADNIGQTALKMFSEQTLLKEISLFSEGKKRDFFLYGR